MNIVLNIIIYIVANTIGLVLLKKSLPADSISKVGYISLFLNVKFLLGFFLYATSFTMWIILLSKKDLSYIYPLVIGLSYVSILLVSLLYLREPFTTPKIIATTLIGCGIIVLSVYR